MEIPEIGVNRLDIPDIRIWISEPSSAIPVAPPVVVNIGIPIVDIPGCVEAHEANNNSKTLQNDDERGLVTYCDGNVPSYNPPDFEPNQMLRTQRPQVDTRQPKSPEAPDLTTPKIPPTTAEIKCPTPAQQAKEPVGAYIEGFRKKIVDYKLIGNECIQITEEVPLPQQIIAGLPSPGTVMTTGGIAVVATASALMAKPLADLLLKVVKPTVKKVMKKIAKIRGKEVRIESLSERRDQQRIRSHAIRKLKGKE